MFTELYAVAKHTPLQISVSPDGARLNVLIVPKPGDDADKGSALTKPIQAIGTPEELDRELPAKLAEYCAAINDLRLKIDLPIEAIIAEAGKGGAKKKANVPAARKPGHASAPKPQKKAAPKPVKPVKKAAAVKAAKPVQAHKPGQPISAEQARHIHTTHPPAAPKSAKPAAAADKSKRATREECLADLHAYLAECESTSVAITRALFLGHNTTGRSYERKFKSWDEFIAEGRKTADEVAADTAVVRQFQFLVEDRKTPGDASAPTAAAPNRGADPPRAGSDALAAKETLSQTALNPAAKWPFPETEPAAAATKHISRVIYLRKDGADDKMLGTSAVPLVIGDKYSHIQLGDLRVVYVEKKSNGDERISVKPWDEESSAVTARVHTREDQADAKAEKVLGAKPRLKLTPEGPAPAGDTTKAEG